MSTKEPLLLTGGLGMVGSAVCRALVTSGRRPVIFDTGHDRSLIRSVEHLCDFEYGSIENPLHLMAVTQKYKPTTILHFAGRLGSYVEQFPSVALQTNLIGTTSIFECARLMGVNRVIFPSTKMIYGHVQQEYQHPHYKPVPEEHPLNPLILYAKLKRATEELAMHYAKLYDLDIIAMRFGSSFGPGILGRSKAIPLMGLIESAIRNEPFQLDCGTEQKDDYCYSGESSNAVVSALNAPLQKGSFRAFNIASGELISLGKIVEVLQGLYPNWQGHVGPGLDYRKIGMGYYFQMDTSKATREFGFKPQFTFKKAVQDYAMLLLNT